MTDRLTARAAAARSVRTLRCLAVTFALPLLAGCAAPTATITVRVDAAPTQATPGVVNSPAQPQQGARVWVTPTTASHPLTISDIFRKDAPTPDGLPTNAAGLATFRVPPDRPFVVTVWLPHFGPVSRTFDGLAEAQRTGPWPLRPAAPTHAAFARDASPNWQAAVITPPAGN